MDDKHLISQIEKLINLVFTKKYSSFVKKVEVKRLLQPDEHITKFYRVELNLYVTEETHIELYEIYLRLKKTRPDNLLSYEEFKEKGTLKNLFLDDILMTEVFGEIQSILEYIKSNLYLIHPINVL